MEEIESGLKPVEISTDREMVPIKIRYTRVRCEPVIDILDAQVFTKDTPIQVYGKINIIDDQGPKTYTFYNRDRYESPQRLYSDNYLLQLMGPGEVPSLNDPMVSVDIKNVDTGETIAHGTQTLRKSTQLDHNDIEQLFTLKFQGGQGRSTSHVELQCAAFTFGVYGQVRTFLYKDSDRYIDEEEGVEFFGLVYAQYNVAKHKHKTHLFNVVKQEHEWVGFGGEILLFRDLVAVPAYSELEISLDLMVSEDAEFQDDGFSVKGTVCFQPGNNYGGYKDVPGGNGYFVRVRVSWQQPSLLNKPHCKEDIIGDFLSLPRWPDLNATHLLEVFSLFIGRPDGKEVNLHGFVSIYNGGGWCNIFSRSKEKAYFLSSGCNLLPMQGPERAVEQGNTFFIKIDLTDVDGHFKIIGCANSSIGIDEHQKPWYDRRLCSVVTNEEEKGFVGVNYTLFSFAVLAIVKVRISSVVPGCFKIYGDIIAFGSNLLYSTIYDKQFFRRVLFTRNEANSLGGQEYIELPRNNVAVPMTSSLCAEVNMYFQIAGGTHHVEKSLRFRIGRPQKKQIESDVGNICFDVEWKVFPSNRTPDWETLDPTDC